MLGTQPPRGLRWLETGKAWWDVAIHVCSCFDVQSMPVACSAVTALAQVVPLRQAGFDRVVG